MKKIGGNESYKFKIQTWESNKGASLGFMAWALYLWIPDLEHCYKLDGSHRNYPLNPIDCERIALDSFNGAIQGRYDNRIKHYILGED